jgi:hypothetical protein
MKFEDLFFAAAHGSRSILDPEFVYTPAAETDLALTFQRVRARLKAEQIKPTDTAPPGAKEPS